MGNNMDNHDFKMPLWGQAAYTDDSNDTYEESIQSRTEQLTQGVDPGVLHGAAQPPSLEEILMAMAQPGTSLAVEVDREGKTRIERTYDNILARIILNNGVVLVDIKPGAGNQTGVVEDLSKILNIYAEAMTQATIDFQNGAEFEDGFPVEFRMTLVSVKYSSKYVFGFFDPTLWSLTSDAPGQVCDTYRIAFPANQVSVYDTGIDLEEEVQNFITKSDIENAEREAFEAKMAEEEAREEARRKYRETYGAK